MIPYSENGNKERNKKHFKKHPYNANYSPKGQYEDEYGYQGRDGKRANYGHRPDYQPNMSKGSYGSYSSQSYGSHYQQHFSQEGGFKEITLNVNGSYFKTVPKDDLGDKAFIDRLRQFIGSLNIAKQFERDALLLKLVKEIESRSSRKMDKGDYAQLVDDFISSAASDN